MHGLAENGFVGGQKTFLLRQWAVLKKGESVTFDDRLSDIANRYGKDSFQYIKAKSCPNSSLLMGFSFASDIVLDERSMSQD